MSVKNLIRACLPRRLGERRILRGPLRGAWLYTSWHDYPGALLGRTEKSLLDWFARNVREGQTWLDVGAHYGYTALALSRLVGPRGRVFAFEPVRETARCVERMKSINGLTNLTVVPCALGYSEAESQRCVNLTRGMADSTIGETGRREQIRIYSLDRLWERIAGPNARIDGIKIDVQGMELETIQGMRGVLARFQPALVVEVHHGVDRVELRERISQAGYCPQGDPIERGCRAGLLADDHSYSFHPLTNGGRR